MRAKGLAAIFYCFLLFFFGVVLLPHLWLTVTQSIWHFLAFLGVLALLPLFAVGYVNDFWTTIVVSRDQLTILRPLRMPRLIPLQEIQSVERVVTGIRSELKVDGRDRLGAALTAQERDTLYQALSAYLAQDSEARIVDQPPK